MRGDGVEAKISTERGAPHAFILGCDGLERRADGCFESPSAHLHFFEDIVLVHRAWSVGRATISFTTAAQATEDFGEEVFGVDVGGGLVVRAATMAERDANGFECPCWKYVDVL